MAREFGKINLGIWQDTDWRKLPPPAQHLYLTLWTHPTLSYCGVVDWRPGRLAALSEWWTAEDIEMAGDCLEARLFIVIDRDTEEVLVRSYVRFDGLMKQPRVAVSFANAYAATSSNTIRGVVIHEAIKLRDREPALGGFAKIQVREMLNLPAIDPRSRDLPIDPFGGSFPHRFGGWFGHGSDETKRNVSGSVSGSRTTATATATNYTTTETSKNQAISSADADGLTKSFNAFWNVYGKKVGKPAALKAWKGAMKKADAGSLIAAAAEHATWQISEGTEDRFWPHAATWLNGERWADERTLRTPATKLSTTDQRVLDNLAVVERLKARHDQQETQTTLRAIGQK